MGGAGGREGGTRVLLACGRGREAEWEGWAGDTKPSGREKSDERGYGTMQKRWMEPQSRERDCHEESAAV